MALKCEGWVCSVPRCSALREAQGHARLMYGDRPGMAAREGTRDPLWGAENVPGLDPSEVT